jgi:DNA polymerase-1
VAVSKGVLVDGSAMMYRAYYKLPGDLRTSSGTPTNASYGFALMFRKLFAGRKPDFGAVVFDPPGPTFRDARFAEYKAERGPMPDALAAQIPDIVRVVEAFNFPHFRVEGYEADDVIGTLTRMARERGDEVLIVSGDKDFCQLIDDGTRMLDAMREITYDRELVRKKWGVPPERFVDLLALIGDKIDNVPGVPGIGAKTAASLLETWGSLDGILEHSDEIKGRAQKALQEHRESALLSRQLITIDRAVPLDRSLDDLKLSPPEPGALNALFRELEFYSLLSEDARVEAEAGDADYPVATDPDALVSELRTAPGAVAVEPLWGGGPAPVADLVGLSFCAASGRAVYLPLHARGAFPDLVRAWFADPAQPKVAHNVKKLAQVLAARDVPLEGVVGDTMLASFLLDPNKLIPHRLDQISKEFLQRTLRPWKRLVGSGQSERNLRDVAAEDAASFAGHRADALFEAWPELSRRLETEGLAGHLDAHEIPLSFVLARMEARGICIDREDLGRLGEEFAERLAEVERRAHEAAGHPFNLGSTKQLSKVLFEELGLPVLKRTKTGYSTAVEVLERLAKRHPIAELVLEHRKLSKLISTYTNVLQAAIHPKTGRIHADFQQTASQTGRLISTEPDLQRTPIRTPEGRRIREAFVAPPGHRLVSADWSQVELRILAHFSEDPLLLESFRTGADVHRRTAGELFDTAPEDVTPEQRSVGKTVNFATIYGQGPTALGQILDVPRKEAEGIIQRYFERYAGVRAWLDQTIASAMETGRVHTLFGRIRRIPELSSNSFMDVQAGQRIASNTPIQGSAADLCKLAMMRIDRALTDAALRARLVLQIHDELVLECPEAEVFRVSELVKHHMESVAELRVPLLAEVGSGRTWSEAH